MKTRSCCSRGTSIGRRTRISNIGGAGLWRGRRRPLGTPPADCIGLYCSVRPSQRIFPYEVSILHDFCPMVVPWAFTDAARDGFVKFLTENILASDVVLSDSHSTKADAAWFSALDPERIVVAPPGPSLCVETHRHRGRVARSDRIGLVVSTIEPRKNAGFLFDWFQKTTLLPPDMELWWVGKLGWMISRAELQRMANPAGGRRVRFLGNVSDARLCRLYQKAGWSIYPSRYEGFGFPILDSLRHGTPVLSSCTSSMGEFDHPGVFFFDPQDPATVDLAWQRLQAAKPVTIPQARLDDLYNWDLVARALLDAHARTAKGSLPACLGPYGPGSAAPERVRRREAPSLPRSRGRSRRLPLASSRTLGCGSGSNCSGPRPLAATGASGGTAGTSSPRCWPATRPTTTCSMARMGCPPIRSPRPPTPSSACCDPTRPAARRLWPTLWSG